MDKRRMITRGVGRFADLFPLDCLILWSGQKILLPFYHLVSDVHLPHISKLYPVRTMDQFINDLDFFCRYYEPVSLAELFQIVCGQRKVNRPVFHLSFDDGLRQLYSDIAPLLLKKSIPASIFINTDFINNHNLFFRYKIGLILDTIDRNNLVLDLRNISCILKRDIQNKADFLRVVLSLGFHDQALIDDLASYFGLDFNIFLSEYRPYLNKAEIKELINSGFTIGGHSLNHPLFKQITIEEQRRQISECLKFIVTEFGVREKYFSFPFSDDGISLDLFNWMFDGENCNLSFGVSGLKKDHFGSHLHRIPMEKTTESASKILKTEYLYFLVKAIFAKNKITRH